MSEIREVSFREMIKNNYNIELEDKDYERLIWTLNNYQIQPTEMNFSVQSSVEMYVNALSTVKDINFKRLHLNLTLEDVIFELFPCAHHFSEKINTIYPKHISMEQKDTTDLPSMDFDKNISIIRHKIIEAHNQEFETNTSYTMVIFNKNSTTTAGIIFN